MIVKFQNKNVLYLPQNSYLHLFNSSFDNGVSNAGVFLIPLPTVWLLRIFSIFGFCKYVILRAPLLEEGSLEGLLIYWSWSIWNIDESQWMNWIIDDDYCFSVIKLLVSANFDEYLHCHWCSHSDVEQSLERKHNNPF